MTPQTRERLEWSWNYSIAEALAEDTARHNAQWVANGIPAGKDQTDADLVQDFLEHRVDDVEEDGRLIIDDEWADVPPSFFEDLRAVEGYAEMLQQHREDLTDV